MLHNAHEKPVPHIFLSCPFIDEIWNKWYQWMDCQTVHLDFTNDHSLQHPSK